MTSSRSTMDEERTSIASSSHRHREERTSIASSSHRHREKQNNDRNEGGGPFPLKEPVVGQEGISMHVLILLVACTLGIEMVATFNQIFTVLYLQFLGVPTMLVSMSGACCSVFSLVLIPLVGWFSNGGSNPMMRKVLSMCMILITYLVGLSGIAFCGIFKIMTLNGIDAGNSSVQMEEPSNWSIPSSWSPNDARRFSSVLNVTDGTTIHYVTMTTEENVDSVTSVISSTPATAFLAILCFSLGDTGFSLSMAFSRVFMLDCTPAFHHTKILLLASSVQSFGGLLFTLFCTLDLSASLNATFNVNGTAATIVLYASVLAIVVFVGFSSTISTGYFLIKKKNDKHDLTMNEQGRNNTPSELQIKRNNSENKFKIFWWKNKNKQQALSESRCIKEIEDDKLPLLKGSKSQSKMYSSYSVSNSTLHTVDEDRNKGTSAANEDSMSSSISCEASSIYKMGSHQQQKEYASQSVRNPYGEYLNESVRHEVNVGPLRLTHEAMPVTVPDDAMTALGKFEASYSMSLSLAHSTFGQAFQTKRFASTVKPNINKEKVDHIIKSRSNRKMIILCISTFLAIGSNNAVTMYSGNVLTLGIYKGDPKALPGTEGYLNYQKGLTNTAWGTLTLYAIYTLLSLGNTKIIQLIGEKIEFTLSHVIFVVSHLLQLLLKTEALFFVDMAAAGLNRVCAFALPYILVNKFIEEQAGSGSSSSNVRVKVMTLIGFLLPLHYLIISCLMGPLMDATGNVWIPTIYGLGTSTAALLTFSSLFLFKK